MFPSFPLPYKSIIYLRKYNFNYDRGELALPKGMKARVQEAAQAQGQSFNAYVEQAIKERYQRETGQEMTWEREKEEER